MSSKFTRAQFGVLFVAASACSMMASEYRGAIRAGGLPFPGATVTAIQGQRRLATSTDERGVFRFADLPDGTWTLQVEALGFEKLSREVGIASDAPAPVWDLQYLSEQALLTSLGGRAEAGVPAAPQASPTAAPQAPQAPAAAQASPMAAPQTPQAPAAPQASPMAAPQAPQSPAIAQASPTAAPQTPQAPAAPQASLTAAPQAPQAPAAARRLAPSAAPRAGFQRLDVAPSADASSAAGQGALKTEELADLTQNAANSFLVQGSISTALSMGPQNDWGPPQGMGMGMPGGPGLIGMGGPGGGPGDGPQGGMATTGGGGRGSGPPGGPGGGPMMGGGGPGGPGGGPGGGFGGPGGPGGPDGGRGGRGGPGGPDWMGRPNARAFGNGRRDPRNMYQFGANFSLDNSALDARSFSVTGANLGKPAYANGRGGLNFGGPLRIPGLVSASRRILFSVNYQFNRNRTGSTSTPVNMPTALERAGDFSQTLLGGAAVTIYDPSTGAPFPGSVIPASRINPTAAAVLKYFPLPDLPFATRNYQTSLIGRNNSQNLNARVSNIQLGSKDRLNFGLGYQGSDSATPNLFQFLDTGTGRGLNANLAWSHSFTTRLTNNLQYTFSRMRQQSNPYFANRENVAAELGILGTSQSPANWGPPNLSFTNYGSLTDGNASLNRNQTSSVANSLSWVRGEHNLTFGGDYRRQQFNQFSDSNGRGAYSFTGSFTSLLVNGVAQSGTGYDLADFLLGMPSTSSIRYGNPDKYFRGAGYDGFVNDDWRISPRLTLIAGLRWEYATPVTELYNRMVNVLAGPSYATIEQVEPGQVSTYYGALPGALIRPDRNGFAPRLGFAWRPLTKGSLVLRGGYGVYRNTSVYNTIAGNLAQQPPFAESLSVAGSADAPLNIQTAFLQASASGATSTYAIDPNYRIGYAESWNLTVQHDLPFSMFGTVGYLGTKGTRLDQQFIPNSVAPGAVESSYPHSFTYETSNGNSTYHAAQFQLNRRFHSGVMWRAAYQLSKSIDDAGTGGRGQGNTPVAQNWLDLAAERGLSSFDARHNLNLQVQYSSGMGTTGGALINGWKGALLKDWTIATSVNLHSGNPFTATLGGSLSQIAGTAVGNTVRAEATGSPIETAGALFNTAAFTQPAAGAWGNAGRNTIPGPTIFSLDSQLGRVFRLGERRSADFQIQAQNVLNRVTITSWGTVLESNTYGLATNAAAMRKITASLRFRF